MKTLLLSMFAVINMSIIHTRNIPRLVITTFEREHAGVFQIWDREGRYFRVEYIERRDNTRRAILFDDDGCIVRRDVKMFSGFPKHIKHYFAAVYPGERCEVWMSKSNRGHKNYYIIRPTGKIWFDHNGKVMRCSL